MCVWHKVIRCKMKSIKYQDSFTMATKRDKINRKESCNSITVIQIGTSTSFAAKKFSTREWISISIHHGKLRADLSITTNKYVPTNGIGITLTVSHLRPKTAQKIFIRNINMTNVLRPILLALFIKQFIEQTSITHASHPSCATHRRKRETLRIH